MRYADNPVVSNMFNLPEGGANINYKKFSQDKQKELGYKILEMNDVFVTVQCKRCGAIRRLQLKSLHKSYRDGKYSKGRGIHNQFCSKYYLNICRKELGSEAAVAFHDFYRRSHERCHNPNNKDYPRYKGKFKFDDFTEFYLSCFGIYKAALKERSYKQLTIDRIDGKRRYEPGNIRFVTLAENLRNKECVRPVRMTNVKTNMVIEAISFGELARKYKDVSYASVLHRALSKNRLYKKQWKIEYIET